MKRWMLLAALMLCLCGAARAERTVYADQGGVKVFSEDGRAGLMDSSGNVLCEARFDAIEPFGDSEYALAYAGGGTGVVRRDGGMPVACEWRSVTVCPEVRAAVCRNGSADYLISLDTGETLLHGLFDFTADGGRVFALTYGAEDLIYYPPFHTRAYDADMRLLYELDAWIHPGFEGGLAAAEFNDGTYGVIDEAGDVVIDGLWLQPTFANGCVYYERFEANPLEAALASVGFGRERVMGILRRHLGAKKADAEELTGFLGPIEYCGVLRPDGTRTDVRGGSMSNLGDGNPPYCVKVSGSRYVVHDTDRYVFVDADGAPALPGTFEFALPFVDGAAVVMLDGRWRLIDRTGAQVGGIEWSGELGFDGTMTLPVVPVNADGGIRLIDRRGEFVTDEVFPGDNVSDAFGDRWLMLIDRDGLLCLYDTAKGGIVRGPSGYWAYCSSDDEVMAFRVDGLWGLMDVAAGAWLAEPFCTELEWLDSNCWQVSLPDGTGAYVGRAGEFVGPAAALSKGSW